MDGVGTVIEIIPLVKGSQPRRSDVACGRRIPHTALGFRLDADMYACRMGNDCSERFSEERYAVELSAVNVVRVSERPAWE